MSEVVGSRHHRDLNARVKITNQSNAQLFLSIHANCNMKSPQTSCAIVFFSEKHPNNFLLANCIQKVLNSITFEVLKNIQDQKRLTLETFQHELANAIANGINDYYIEIGDRDK